MTIPTRIINIFSYIYSPLCQNVELCILTHLCILTPLTCIGSIVTKHFANVNVIAIPWCRTQKSVFPIFAGHFWPFLDPRILTPITAHNSTTANNWGVIEPVIDIGKRKYHGKFYSYTSNISCFINDKCGNFVTKYVDDNWIFSVIDIHERNQCTKFYLGNTSITCFIKDLRNAPSKYMKSPKKWKMDPKIDT